MNNSSVLLSIKPKFANLILDHEKDIELRRTLPKFPKGSTIYLYATSPECAIVGSVTVNEVRWLKRNYLWRKYGKRARVTYEEFKNYFIKNGHGCAIELTSPIRYVTPVFLSDIRKKQESFTPPQSYQYVREDDAIAEILNDVLNTE